MMQAKMQQKTKKNVAVKELKDFRRAASHRRFRDQELAHQRRSFFNVNSRISSRTRRRSRISSRC